MFKFQSKYRRSRIYCLPVSVSVNRLNAGGGASLRERVHLTSSWQLQLQTVLIVSF